jgi:hypothetical protein
MVLSHFPAVRHLIALAVNILEESKPWGKGGLGNIPQTEGLGHTRMGGPSTEKEEGRGFDLSTNNPDKNTSN